MKKLIKLFFIVILTLFPVSVKGTSKKGTSKKDRGRSTSKGSFLQKFNLVPSKKSKKQLKKSESNKSVSTSNSLNKIKNNSVDDKVNVYIEELNMQELRTKKLREARVEASGLSEVNKQLKNKVRRLSEENEGHKKNAIKLGATNEQLRDKLGHTTQKISRLNTALTNRQKNVIELGMTKNRLENELEHTREYYGTKYNQGEARKQLRTYYSKSREIY